MRTHEWDKAIRISCYIIGVIVILFGVLFIFEYEQEASTQFTAQYVAIYPIVGPVLLVGGAIIFYLGVRFARKPKMYYR